MDDFASASAGLSSQGNIQMENLFDFADREVFATSVDLKGELITSLTSFIKLYSQRRDRLQRSSESFMLTAARLHDDMHKEVSEKKTGRGLLTVFGGVLGAPWGGVFGAAFGAFGAVTATAWAWLCDDINALCVTGGFVCSVFGGVVGGAFGGVVGGAFSGGVGGAFGGGVGGAVDVEATGGPVYGFVREAAWFTIGFAAGVAIGGTYGGAVGAAGGASGGGFGALCGKRLAVNVLESISVFFRMKVSKAQKIKSEKVTVEQKTQDFRETIKPLVEELKSLKTICDQMAASAFVRVVAGQTAKTLAFVTTMEKTIVDSQKATDMLQFVSSVEEAARQSKTITEEVEKTREEAEKLRLVQRHNSEHVDFLPH